MDMLTEPVRCMRLLNWIADAYIVLCRHFAQAAGLPITDVHVGECSCCMVSPALVEEFVAPVTSRIGEALGPVRFHSCGTSTHILKSLAGIANLHTLDLGSETSIGKAREIFGREMPITIAPSPHDMSAEGTEPILDWAKRVLEENAGGNLGYVYHLEPSYNVETIYALTEFVQHQPGFQEVGGSRNG
jgi:uroporphyrinogen-III decarboxylase